MTEHRCDNCGHEFSDKELSDEGCFGLINIDKLWERLDPGGIVPSGECPNCGALCYPKQYEFVPRAVEDMLRELVELYEGKPGCSTDGLEHIPADLAYLLEKAGKLLDSYH